MTILKKIQLYLRRSFTDADGKFPQPDAHKPNHLKFHNDPEAAREAYFQYNGDTAESRHRYHPELIARAIDFGYLGWPRKIAGDVYGKDVLDVGCGTGLHAVGYVVVGCRTYTGVDPKMKRDSDRSKDLRRARKAPFGWTPRQMMDLLPHVALIPGTFEDMAPDATYDIAVLHNVTEHLLDLETVFRGIWERLRPDGVLLFNHHNFYCWNGHHQPPKTVEAIDPDDPEQMKYLDWAHLSFEPPEGHAFLTSLNRIRMDDLRAITDRYFDVFHWEEKPIDALRGANRLTPEILERCKQYSKRELTTQHVLCRASRRPNIDQ